MVMNRANRLRSDLWSDRRQVVRPFDRCVQNGEVSLEMPVREFEFQGHLVSAADGATEASPSYGEADRAMMCGRELDSPGCQASRSAPPSVTVRLFLRSLLGVSLTATKELAICCLFDITISYPS